MRRAFLIIAFLICAGLARAEWNVIDAGAKPDGATDATAAFQKALDQAGEAGGGIVTVPAGHFAIRGNLSIPAGVTLQGTYRVPPNEVKRRRGQTTPTLNGTVLLAYAGRGSQEGPPFIRLAGDCAVLAGLIVTYPEWKQSDVPPAPYPPCVLANGAGDVAVQDCLLINPYEGIKLVRAPRHFVCRVFGYPIWRGLYVDECYDIGRVENCHFWPFGVRYNPKDPYCLWINVNGVAFEFGRTDWHYVVNTFCFGYGVGYKFSKTATGCANGNFLGLGSDSSRRSVLVEMAQAPGLLITNGEFVGRWESGDSVGVELAEGAGGKVSLVNCSFWGPLDKCIWARGGAGSQLTASACHFQQWDVTGEGSPAIQVDGGAAIIQGNTFVANANHVQVGEAVRSAIVTANQAPGGFYVHSAIGKRCQAFGNEENPVEWTAEARAHYRLKIGALGDGVYLTGFHGAERAGDADTTRSAFRWSAPNARLRLPINPGQGYTVRVRTRSGGNAAAPDAGFYVGEKKVVALERDGEAEGRIEPQSIVTQASSPPGESRQDACATLELALRCKIWRPREVQKGNGDGRELGLQLLSVELIADGAPARTFNANKGGWIE